MLNQINLNVAVGVGPINDVGLIYEDSEDTATERAENRRFRRPHYSLTPSPGIHLAGNPANKRINLILQSSSSSLS